MRLQTESPALWRRTSTATHYRQDRRPWSSPDRAAATPRSGAQQSGAAPVNCDDEVMDDLAGHFRPVASRWDLAGLRDEVAAALGDMDAHSRPYVPSQWVRALDMLLDSYGDRSGAGD